MPWVTPSTRTTGTLITAAIWNQDVVDNPVALRLGSLALVNQTAGNFILAQSATQLTAEADDQVLLFLEVFG